jgi:outer membrane protein assembly factor BamB
MWRRRARLRRRGRRVAAAIALLFIASWITVENIGVARFLPAPASNLSQIASSDAWPTGGGGPLRDGIALTSGPIGQMIVWDADLNSPPAGGPIIADGVVFIGSTDGLMHALSLSDGTQLWVSDLQTRISSTASYAGGFVFVGLLDGYVVALDATTGDTVWRFKADQAIRSSSAIVDGVLYVGSSDRRLYALDAATGNIRWSFATGGRITSGPSVNERQVVVIAQDNLVHFIDKKTAKLKFDYEISLTNGSAALAGDSVFVVDVNGGIRRIHWEERVLPFEKGIRSVRRWLFRWGMTDELPPQKGVVWVTQDPTESFEGTPAVDRFTVFISTSKGQLLALERETGVELWRAMLGSSALTSPTVAGGHIFVGDESGYLSAVNSSTGEVVWQLSVGHMIAESIAIGDGILVVANDAGRVFAYR